MSNIAAKRGVLSATSALLTREGGPRDDSHHEASCQRESRPGVRH
jgi:hypothetical protein